MLELEFEGLRSEMEKLLKPFMSFQIHFHFNQFRSEIEVIIQRLEKKLKLFSPGIGAYSRSVRRS